MRDGLGMFCSGLCLFHCLLSPVSLAVGLALLGDERVHQVLLMPALTLAVLSFPAGYRRHRDILLLAMGAGGALSMVVAVAAGGSWETPLSVIGGAGLIGSHWLNRRRLACDCSVRRLTPAPYPESLLLNIYPADSAGLEPEALERDSSVRGATVYRGGVHLNRLPNPPTIASGAKASVDSGDGVKYSASVCVSNGRSISESEVAAC